MALPANQYASKLYGVFATDTDGNVALRVQLSDEGAGPLPFPFEQRQFEVIQDLGDGAFALNAILTGTLPPFILPDTGVVPGTYGTSTSVPQFTVDAKGRLTFAANVPINGPGLGSITVATGAGTGVSVAGSPVSLSGTVTIGSTGDAIRFANLGLNSAAPTGGGQIATVLGANGITGFLSKRATDTAPTGKYIDLQTVAGASLFNVEATGIVNVLGPGTTPGTHSVAVTVLTGTDAAPITADLPSMFVSRREEVTAPTGLSSAILARVAGTGTGQPTAIIGESFRYGAEQGFPLGAGDSLAIGGVARNYGTGFAAFGGYFEANGYTATAGAISIETETRNHGLTSHPVGDSVPMMGLDISYSSTGGDFAGSQAIGIRGVAGSGRWDAGIVFGFAGFDDSIITASLYDLTSSANILYAPSGSHTNGINLAAGATFSGNAFSSPGFAVDGSGKVSNTLNSGYHFNLIRTSATARTWGFAVTGSGSFTLDDITGATARLTITTAGFLSGPDGISVSTGYRIGGTAASGTFLLGNGTNFVASTTTLPNSATTGDLLHATASNTYGNLAAVAAGSYLRSAGTSTAPVWSTLILPNGVTAGSIVFASATNTYDQNNASLFWDNSNNRLGIGTTSPVSQINVVADGASAAESLDAYGTSSVPTLTGRRARGSLGTPAAVQANDVLLSLESAGWDSNQFNTTATPGAIRIRASETWTQSAGTTTADGAFISFLVTATGGTTRTERFRVGPTAVTIGNADPATPLGGSIYFVGVAQASLGTPSNGTVVYCTDCTIANPCAGGGTGALAKRLNGVWVCN